MMTRRMLMAVGAAATLALQARRVAAQTIGGPYYVSPTGSTTGNGTREQPWPTIDYAVRKVGGGQTIIVLPGTYLGRVHLPRLAAGKPTAPTIIQAESKWDALLIGSGDHTVFMEEGTDWVIFDGLQITGCVWNGIRIQGNNVTVRNCWIHNCGHMGLSAHGRNGTVIERNLVEYNGRHPLGDHGIYCDGDGILISSNVVRHNSGCGIHLYAQANNCLVVNNLVHGHYTAHAIILWSTPTATNPGGGNVVAFNTVPNGFSAIQVFNGINNTIAYNIAMGSESAIYVRGATNTLESGNLKILGKPTAENDPRFLDPGKDVYWLKAASAARNRVTPLPEGKTLTAPSMFTGAAFQKDLLGLATATRTDVGAFQYNPALEDPAVRTTWSNGWPYQRPSSFPVDPHKQPDLWAVLG